MSKDQGHRPRQGGRQQNSREKNKKKKTVGPTASKDLVPRQRQGGRQQNSREKNKKKKTVGPTASKDLIPRQRQGGSTTELTDEKKKRTCFINWNVYRNLTLTATGSILSKRIGIAPEAKQTRGTLPNQTVAPLANNNKINSPW